MVCSKSVSVSTAGLHKDSKDIWREEEVAEGPQYEEHHDSRPQPEWVHLSVLGFAVLSLSLIYQCSGMK